MTNEIRPGVVKREPREVVEVAPRFHGPPPPRDALGAEGFYDGWKGSVRDQVVGLFRSVGAVVP